MSRRAVALGAVTAAVITAMVLAAARWLAAQPTVTCRTDACDCARWVESHRDDPPTSVNGYAHDPLLGWVLQPNLRPRMALASRITSDALGARGPTSHPRARTGAPRVVALGDSYTFGSCVNDDETWPAVLERALPGAEVVNLGVPGYGLDQMLLRWERDGAAYRPDVVVLGYIGEDVSRAAMRFFAFAKPMFELDGDGLRLTNTPVPTPAALYAREAALGPTLRRDLSRLFRVDGFMSHPRVGAYPEALSRRILQRLAREVAATGAELVVVYLPESFEADAIAVGTPRVYRQTCPPALGARCLDVTQALNRVVRSDPGGNHFRCHYSPTLQRRVAEALSARVAPLLAGRR